MKKMIALAGVLALAGCLQGVDGKLTPAQLGGLIELGAPVILEQEAE